MKIIGLDVGTKRIGVAKADSKVKIALANGYLKVDGTELSKLAALARTYGADVFVVGLPRSNDGNETKQSLYARNFARSLSQAVPGTRVVMQDESLTSVVAEERLKMRGRPYEKGDIDAEAATIILQDWLERASNAAKAAQRTVPPATLASAQPGATAQAQTRSAQATSAAQSQSAPNAAANQPKAAAGERIVDLVQKPTDAKAAKSSQKPKKGHRKGKIFACILVIVLLLCGGTVGGYFYFNQAVNPGCSEDCSEVKFTINDGDSTEVIASNLENAGLVRNSLAFRAYYYLNYGGQSLKAGEYTLNSGMSPAEIIESLIEGPVADVFTLTILPGENIFEVTETLVELGYDESEVDAALSANYDHPVLAGKPDDANLEGYLYGETYEFYTGESLENIVLTLLDQLYEVVQENDLEAKFAEQGLSLYEGITLASIVQKEADNAEDYAKVAQVFYSRLEQGTSLGSDITVQYALDLVDPNREIYTDNASALTIDSPYNTRLYTGLTPGPVSNPGESALVATANPADTDYLFFLTGDDGMMYYSTTEAGHEENIANYCQELCAASL